MLLFNELHVTSDGRYLIVDVSVQTLDYYKDVYIDSLIIHTADNFSETGPNPTKCLKKVDCENSKHYRMVLDLDGIDNTIFFVYAVASGTPSADTPCGQKQSIVLGVAYNKFYIYNLAISALKGDSCALNRDLMDFIFRLRAFEIAIKVGKYKEAIDFWKEFFTNTSSSSVSLSCGCHG